MRSHHMKPLQLPPSYLLFADVFFDLDEVTVLERQRSVQLVFGVDEPLAQPLHALLQLANDQQSLLQLVQSTHRQTEV